MRVRRWAAVLLGWVALLGSPRPVLAGAWPQPEDGGQVLLGLTPSETRLQGFNRLGQPAGQGRDRRIEGSIYWEHGLTDRWTFGMQPRLQAIWMRDQSGSSSNLGAAEEKLFLRNTLFRGDWNALSLQGQVSAPGLAQRTTPQVAEPHASYEIRALYGHSFNLPAGMSGFVDLQAAFNYRPGPPADEMLYSATAGLRFLPGWMLMAQGLSTIGLRNARAFGADYAVYRMALSVVMDISPTWQAQLSYLKDLGGRHIALGQGMMLGLGYRY